MDGREEILVERDSTTSPEEIAQYKVGEVYTKTFSTTSPPAFVSNDYRITKKDRKGLWGILLDSQIWEW